MFVFVFVLANVFVVRQAALGFDDPEGEDTYDGLPTLLHASAGAGAGAENTYDGLPGVLQGSGHGGVGPSRQNVYDAISTLQHGHGGAGQAVAPQGSATFQHGDAGQEVARFSLSDEGLVKATAIHTHLLAPTNTPF